MSIGFRALTPSFLRCSLFLTAFCCLAAGCGQEVLLQNHSDSALRAVGGTKWSVVPIPRLAKDGGGIFESWALARDLVGPTGTISLIGHTMEHFWSVGLEYLIGTTGLKVFPQLAFPAQQIPDVETHQALAVAVARRVRPEWFNICVECHEWLADEQFVARLDQIRDAIHDVSPDTRVCISVQYEMALFHGRVEDLVAAWPNADGVGLSTYPQVFFADVPSIDYYREFLLAANGKPVIVAEAGWNIVGQEDVNRQVAFLGLLRLLGAKLVNYYYLFDDTSAVYYFSAMGLVKSDGTRRPAYDEFQRFAQPGGHSGSTTRQEPPFAK